MHDVSHFRVGDRLTEKVSGVHKRRDVLALKHPVPVRRDLYFIFGLLVFLDLKASKYERGRTRRDGVVPEFGAFRKLELAVKGPSGREGKRLPEYRFALRVLD